MLHSPPSAMASLPTEGAGETPVEGLGPGERLPDFLRVDQFGRPYHLYGEHLGEPVRLWRAPAEPPGSAPPLGSVALRRGTPEENRAWAEQIGFEGRVLADDGALLDHLFGTTGADLLSSDENLRILDIRRSADDFPVDVHDAASRLRPSEPPIVRRQAPVLIVPRVLLEDECRALIALFDGAETEASGMPHVEDGERKLLVDLARKARHDLRLEDRPENEWLASVVARRLLPELERSFGFSAGGYESFKLVCYGRNGNGYFRTHRDNLDPSARHRRFAMTIVLNEGFEGGELGFPEFDDAGYAPERGSAIVFSCHIAHEVRPVRSGLRYAVISFFTSR